jgi:hypothetical protein
MEGLRWTSYLNELRQQLVTYQNYQGTSDRATKKLLRVGRTVESEIAVIQYQGRTRCSDWAVCICD